MAKELAVTTLFEGSSGSLEGVGSSAYDNGLDRGESQANGKPIPLELDWSSPAGEAHHEAMLRLDPEDPVRVAHLSIYTGKD